MSAREDVETLLNKLMPFVENQLSTEGILAPFGAVVTNEETIEHVYYAHPDVVDASVGLVEGLSAALKKKADEGNIKLIALVLDVTATLPENEAETDAVQFRFEHQDRYAAEIFIPYTATEDGLVFGKLFAQTGDAVFFPE